MTNYDWLISRLDAFIRKYYANRVIRGGLIFLICLLFYILTVSIGEYFLYMPVWLRMGIVSFFVLAGVAALVIWVIIPLARMARLGKIISHEQAATIIGRHFPEISDKLLNILQLKKQSDTQASRELIEASIDQKASQISVIPITTAIDFSKNKKYLSYLLPLLLVGVFILVAAPDVFRDASARLLQPEKVFERPAPFRFIVKTNPLQAIRNADFTLKVVTEGAALPAEIMIDIAGSKVPMQALEGHAFEYTFRNVTEPVSFRFFAAGFYSQPYTLQVVQKPVLKDFKVYLDYPGYTGRKDEERNSLGDMTLPVGTKVSWAFVAEHTDEAAFRLGNGPVVNVPGHNTMFGYQYRFLSDTAYTFILHNNQTVYTDSYHYQVQVIPDQYPVVQVQQFRDSVTGKQILLNGTAGDDYGITRVLFHYDVTDDQDQKIATRAVPLSVKPGALTSFQYYFDISTLNLLPGQKLSYYIEAWDNDGVHGSKASRSEVMTYQMYNVQQIDSAINENSQQINAGISNSAQKSKQLEHDYQDMQTQSIQNNKSDWEQQQFMQQMQQQQEQLKSQVENIKKRFEDQMQQSQQKQYSDDVKEKQQDLKKQLDNILNKELAEQMKKLQDLMDKMNKDQTIQQMQNMQQDNKLFNMDLERVKELMKQLEMQMKMEDVANKMSDLAKKQLSLKDQTDQGKTDNKKLSDQQQDLKKELDKVMKGDMKDLKDMNAKSEDPQQLDAPQKKGEQAGQDMQQSEDQLGQGQKSNASQSQSKAAKNLQEMADMMMQSAGGMSMQQVQIDIQATRQLLTNIIRLSFDQEDLMKSVGNTSIASQDYLTNQEEQNRLHANSYMIRDSLFALSKRVPHLPVDINKETTELERNMKMAVNDLEDRKVNDALIRQQYVMTRTNNLALTLNELLANLIQMQQQGQQSGSGSCSKPGGAKPKSGKGAGQQLADIITKQQNLGNAMQQMQNAMQHRGQQGEKPGEQPGKKPGGQQGQGQKGDKQQHGGQNGGESGDAEELARLAEQQAAIRRQLQELSSLLNSKGMGANRLLQPIQQDMDKIETDLVNRRLNGDIQMRQREILTHMLEAEKAVREQDQDDKRSSRTGEEMSRPVPPELQKYMQDRKQMLDLYKTVPPQLKPYYRNMVEQYFQMIGK